MPVNLIPPDADKLFPINGVRIGIAEAGIRKANRKDLTVVLIDQGASVAGVFTQNRFCAAPVQICREHLAPSDTGQSPKSGIRAMVINTGNANAGTGEDGLMRARATCESLAHVLNISSDQVLPFSTGVIMEPLPYEKIIAGLDTAIENATENNWLGDAEHDAMTAMSLLEVHVLIDHLTAAQRDVVLLRVVGDLSVAETAKVLDTSESAVRALQTRALRDLRKRLSKTPSRFGGGER